MWSVAQYVHGSVSDGQEGWKNVPGAQECEHYIVHSDADEKVDDKTSEIHLVETSPEHPQTEKDTNSDYDLKPGDELNGAGHCLLSTHRCRRCRGLSGCDKGRMLES